jgi:tetratricopeptide (TPR) repeat protein
MAHTRHRRKAAARLVFAAALTLAGAGAGVAAALAASGSGLIRAAGGAAGGIAGLCAAAAAASADTAKQRRDATAAALEERGQALGPVISDPPQDHSALGLLLPTRQRAAPFRGRAADLAWLQAWLDTPDAHPAALVTGPAGTGKTRLLTQFAATRPPTWTAGWLQPGHGASALAAVRGCGDPALILIDNADTTPDTPALLAALASHPHGSQVRVALTARTAEALTQAAAQLPEQARWILAPANLPVRPIGPFGSTDDHARWFAEATRAYAAALGTPPPDLPAPTATGTATTAAAAEPVLTIQAQALLTVLETQRRRPQHPDTQDLPFDQVAAALFEHEQGRWQQAAQQTGSGLADLDAPVQHRAIAALILSRAATEPDAITALHAVPDLAGATPERLARIARWAFGLYPPPPVQIQPDMLAEWFLITQLTTAPGLATHLDDLTGDHTLALLTLLAHASDHMSAAIPLYTRLINTDPPGLAAAADAALTARTAQPQLDTALAARITSTHWAPETLDDLDHHLPEGTLPRTRAALSAATLDHTRETGTPDDLARALLRHGASLRNLARHREALAAREEALALWRDLAAANPAYQPDLAGALNNYGTSLRDLGRNREALAADEEALALYRDLAAANPARQPSVAGALNNYGTSLRDLGQNQEALAAFEEALALYRDLAAANPAYQPDLAGALNNYGTSLRDLGRHREALAADEEALALYRDLAAANRAHQPGVAGTLNNYGNSLTALGRHREALAALEEALTLRRALAAANPAHQPDLAIALTNYGTSLTALGRHREALAADEEALALYRALAAANPARQPDLARTLNNYGTSLRDLGRHREALAADEEALALYRALAAANPARQPDLARTLNNYGNSLTALGRHREALAAFEEALTLRRALAAANPAHQPSLAIALTNYGASLRNLGRHREALTYDREALELYAILARNDPDLYGTTYKHHLAELRRTYDLLGDQPTSTSLHLPRDTKDSDQP